MTTFSELPRCDASEGSCHLCGDEAVIGRVIEIDAVQRTALVAFDGHATTVALDLVEADVGDTLLVHLGFAIERVRTA